MCNPFSKESGLRAYAHITADGMLKHSSFDQDGISIEDDGVVKALQRLGLQARV